MVRTHLLHAIPTPSPQTENRSSFFALSQSLSLSPPSPTPAPQHIRVDTAAITQKPHDLSTSPPPPGSPMPPAASLYSRSAQVGISSSSQPAPPPEVEATLSKLTSHKNVTGCLILSRPEALIIRAGGKDFEPSGPGAHDRSERLRRVVKLVRQTMDILTPGVGDVDQGVSARPQQGVNLTPHLGGGEPLRSVEPAHQSLPPFIARIPFSKDELGFVRIRTHKYEMMISPSKSAGPPSNLMQCTLLTATRVIANLLRRKVPPRRAPGPYLVTVNFISTL